MSDTYHGSTYHSKLVKVDGDTYSIRGETDGEISMFIDVEDSLECERDNLQKQIGEVLSP